MSLSVTGLVRSVYRTSHCQVSTIFGQHQNLSSSPPQVDLLLTFEELFLTLCVSLRPY